MLHLPRTQTVSVKENKRFFSFEHLKKNVHLKNQSLAKWLCRDMSVTITGQTTTAITAGD